MRGNGLSAESYVAIGDLDPVIAEAMLGVLREAGVAAYTEPCPPAPGAYLEVRLPQVPCDRLYVDEAAQLRARDLLDEHLPALREASRGDADKGEEPNPGTEPAAADRSLRATFDEDQVWADIVAGFDLPAGDVVGRWPASEDLEPETPKRAAPAATTDSTTSSVPTTDGATTDPSAADSPAKGTEAESRPVGEAGTAPDPAPERYVPPPPPPLPRLDTPTKGAWLAMGGGLVMLLLAAVASAYVPTWFAFVGVVAFISGFLVLVVRMKGGPPDDEDGAIV